MTLIIAESFEQISGQTDLLKRWAARSTGLTFDASVKKNGRQSMLANPGTETLRYDFTSHYAGRVYVSFWFRFKDELSGYSKIMNFWTNNATWQGLGLYLSANHRLGWKNGYEPISGLSESEIQLLPLIWYHVEVCGRMHASIDADDCRVKINGVLDSALTMPATTDTRNGGFDEIGGVHIGRGPRDTWFDNVVIWDAEGAGTFSDDFIGMVQFQTLAPDGNGTTSDFTGSDADQVDNYLHLDEDEPDGDTSYIESSTVTDVDLHAYPALSPTPGLIVGVQSFLVAKKTDSDARGIKPITRVAGTNYQGDEVTLTNGTYEWTAYMWDDNPDDAAAWEEADVNGAEFGTEVTT
jgi:hypothetical protein